MRPREGRLPRSALATGFDVALRVPPWNGRLSVLLTNGEADRLVEDAINEFFDGETDIYKVEELELRD